MDQTETDVTVAEQAAYYRMLTKSTDYSTREYGAEQLRRLELAAADVVKAGPKGYVHGWIRIGVHPEESQDVHDHLDRWRDALNNYATDTARGHLTDAVNAARHKKTRRAIERHAARHRYSPYDQAPGAAAASRAELRDFRRTARAYQREARRGHVPSRHPD